MADVANPFALRGSPMILIAAGAGLFLIASLLATLMGFNGMLVVVAVMSLAGRLLVAAGLTLAGVVDNDHASSLSRAIYVVSGILLFFGAFPFSGSVGLVN